MSKTVFFSLLALLIQLSLSACGILESQLTGLTIVSEENNPVVKKTEEMIRRDKINQHLGRGDFRTALAMVRKDIKQGTPEKELKAEYLQALNGVIGQGQALLTKNNPEQAGLLFRTALSNFPTSAELIPNAHLSSQELHSKIKLCATHLTEKGIIAYRAGNLEEAIKVWEKILIFYPHHQASQDSIQTAHIQLTNLKKITADQ